MDTETSQRFDSIDKNFEEIIFQLKDMNKRLLSLIDKIDKATSTLSNSYSINQDKHKDFKIN